LAESSLIATASDSLASREQLFDERGC
jgi:hypothetical protein